MKIHIDWWISASMAYCGIIIVREGPIFLAFVGNPCQRIYITTNMCKHLFNISLQIRTCYQRNYVHTNQEHFNYPRTLTSTNKNDSTVFFFQFQLYPIYILFFFYLFTYQLFLIHHILQIEICSLRKMYGKFKLCNQK